MVILTLWITNSGLQGEATALSANLFGAVVVGARSWECTIVQWSGVIWIMHLGIVLVWDTEAINFTFISTAGVTTDGLSALVIEISLGV